MMINMMNMIVAMTVFGLCPLQSVACMGQGPGAWLVIHAPHMDMLDTVEVRVWDDYLFDRHLNPYRLYSAVNDGGYYRVAIDSVGGLSRMSLTLSYRKVKGMPNYAILEDYLLTPGDSVELSMTPRQGVLQPSGGYDGGEPILLENWAVGFSGRGAEKYRARFGMDELTGSIARKGMAMNPYPTAQSHLRVRWDVERCDTLRALELAYLESHADGMDGAVVEQLRADVMGKFGYEQLRAVNTFFSLRGQSPDQVEYVTELAKVRLFFSEELHDKGFLEHAANSPFFMRYLRLNYELGHRFAGQGYALGSMFEWIASQVRHGRLRDRVLTDLLIFRFDTSPSHGLWQSAMAEVEDPFCLAWIEKLGKVLPGMEMPGFSLPGIDGKYHMMDGFAGKVVFLDFWYAGCIPCRKFMKEVLTPVSEDFKDDSRVVFLTVSTDTREMLAKVLEKADFMPEHSLKLYTDGLRFDHPLIKYFGIVAYPTPILVGKDGRIVASGAQLKTKDALVEYIKEALVE